jgi:hypothetical protein
MPRRLFAAPIRKVSEADAATFLTRLGYVDSASAQLGGRPIQPAAKGLISRADRVNRRAIAVVDPTVSASSRATRTADAPRRAGMRLPNTTPSNTAI